MVIDTQVLLNRVESIESTLNQRGEAIRNIYDFMQKTNDRLTQIEACTSASNHLWSRMLPFLVVLFTLGLSIGGAVLFHVYGGL
jgi:hypothetical protein